MRGRRGGAMIESALVTSVFLVMLVGIMDFAWMGFAVNSINFGAHRGARFAALHGSASGSPASLADVQTQAKSWIVALDPAAIVVNVTWTPNNKPGSTVEVKLSYNYQPMLIPVSATTLALHSTSKQRIVQ